MDYKNFLNRALISLIFISIYTVIFYTNFENIFYLILIIYLFIFLEIFLFFKKNKIIIIFYVILSFLSFLNTDLSNDTYLKFNLLIITIISFDIFSYISGKIFGKHKLFKFISPNKTLEGLIGGIFFSILLSSIYVIIIQSFISIFDVFFISLIIVSSLCGDLIESFFKRTNNLKNSSNFLSGHGGFFDRFDSFILCMIVYFFYETIL